MFPRTIPELLSLALWLAGAGHFVVLIASFQVPYRLHWKQDLAKLKPFNRKLLWVHGGVAVFTILFFGVVTLTLHDEFLRGGRSALAWLLFIGLFWLLRVVVDLTYYDHSDWPEGRTFLVGHALLTALFCFLSATYLSLAIWHVRTA